MEKDYTQRLQKIEAELNRWLPESSIEAGKVFPGLKKDVSVSSFDALLAPLKDILSRGGKRWRPLLMTLICETLGGKDASVPLAPLIEFSHNASLIHDDIEDDSFERRGKPAVHKIYGTDTAINSGSFFYFLSLCCIDSYSGGNREVIYKIWAEYMRKLHLGQAMDISWHRDISYIPGVDEYYAMCGMKTGSLASLAAGLGVYAAASATKFPAPLATKFPAQQLSEAAEKLGIGFQILDDVKNLTTGNPGKKRGDDFVEGKKSLPVILFLQKNPDRREQVFYCFHEAKTNGVTAPEVDEMIKIMAGSGVLTEAEEKARSFIKEARDVFRSLKFSGIPINEESCNLLDDLISSIS